MAVMVVQSLLLSSTFMIISLLMRLVQLIKLMVGIVVLNVHHKSNAETAIHQENAGLKRTLRSMLYLSTESSLEKMLLFRRCFREDQLVV